MTATERGWKNGRSEAVVNMLSSHSDRALLAAVEAIKNSTSTESPPGRSRTSKPDLRNTSIMGRLSVWVTAQKRVNPWRTASSASRSSSSDPKPLPWKASCTANATSAVLSFFRK
jgi:hypothetical protein